MDKAAKARGRTELDQLPSRRQQRKFDRRRRRQIYKWYGPRRVES